MLAHVMRELTYLNNEITFGMKDYERDYELYYILHAVYKAASKGAECVVIHNTFESGIHVTLLGLGFSIVEEHDRTTISWED